MNTFKIGDLVAVIDEDLVGKVAFAKANYITIITQDGFTFEYKASKLVLHKAMTVQNFSVMPVSKTPLKLIHKKTGKGKPLRELTVDLHLHEFIENERYMSSFEKLESQLHRAKNKLDEARLKRISKVIFIHGVGQGVLKKELHKLLEGKTDIEFYDADFAQYGHGATEVKLYRPKNTTIN